MPPLAHIPPKLAAVSAFVYAWAHRGAPACVPHYSQQSSLFCYADILSVFLLITSQPQTMIYFLSFIIQNCPCIILLKAPLALGTTCPMCKICGNNPVRIANYPASLQVSNIGTANNRLHSIIPMETGS